MLIEIPYNRLLAAEYAKKWALKRNSAYFNFQGLGGDCTNFVSQCLFAGSDVMNYTPIVGWYYNSSSDRSASWSGVKYLFDFLTSNKSAGPYAVETDIDGLEKSDVIQLSDGSYHFYHSHIVTETKPQVLVAAHTFDAYMRPLNSYIYQGIRYLHIVGVRKYQ